MQTNPPLPMTLAECAARGWEALDFVLITGDAYVDHPSFGAAVIGRVLESEGFRVGILAQPDWRTEADFLRLGLPRYAFLVTSGNMDSMVNHYTVAKKRRHQDAYSPGGQAGLRPDRALLVYCNACRRVAPHIPIVIGGLEASLRRLAHYDYWQDRVRASVLLDTGADLLSYGMGERSMVEIAHALAADIPVRDIQWIDGTCYRLPAGAELPQGAVLLDAREVVAQDKAAYARTFYRQYTAFAQRSILVQPHGRDRVVQNPPSLPLSQAELDAVYELPYTRLPHPFYRQEIPALAEVAFSVTSVRGCLGGCHFCSLATHQGRVIQARSKASILKEVELLTRQPGFAGYIHDIGGPTANFFGRACANQDQGQACAHRQCLFPQPCPNLRTDQSAYAQVLREAAAVPGVKRVFVRSGLRCDYLLLDTDGPLLEQLVRRHVSGQLRVAPEHVNAKVCRIMGKPGIDSYEQFCAAFARLTKQAGKEQYVVPYFMSSHPGCDLTAAVELAVYMQKRGIHAEQVQDFYPTPGTLSTCMYYTGLDPRTLRPVYVPRTPQEKAMQRALLQWRDPKGRQLVEQALRLAGREDLIGWGKHCLIRPDARHKQTNPPPPDPKRKGGVPHGRSGKGSKGKGRGRTP